MDHLDELESQSIYLLREAYHSFSNLCMPWSIGKDSNVLIWLSKKAFCGKIPCPLMHIDTTYEFPEMLEFRDWAEVDIWRYIERENIPIPQMYFARRGEDGQFYRFRSLGCWPITKPVLSTASNIPEITGAASADAAILLIDAHEGSPRWRNPLPRFSTMRRASRRGFRTPAKPGPDREFENPLPEVPFAPAGVIR